MPDRRAFLRASGATFLGGLGLLSDRVTAGGTARFVAACRTAEGGYGAAVFNDRGNILHFERCPARAHDAAVCGVSGRVAVFARRPGTFAIVFDPRHRQLPVAIVSAPGRHFFGHGVFSRDGRLLYATENDFDAARGVIGIYDATDQFQRVGEFETRGVGPHEILLTPNGRTLAVANGGIETHPRFGRVKLNLDRMEPSIAFVDAETGLLLDQYRAEPRWHRLSMRHLGFDRDGDLWFGCQYQGSIRDHPPLIGKVRRGIGIRLFNLPARSQQAMRNYVGSVATSQDGERLAFSSPRGGVVVVIDRNGRFLKNVAVSDGCGLVAHARGFLATSGEGQVVTLDRERRVSVSGVRWDNHVARID